MLIFLQRIIDPIHLIFCSRVGYSATPDRKKGHGGTQERCENNARRVHITGWAVAQTCCISQCAKYRKSGIFGYPWEQNP